MGLVINSNIQSLNAQRNLSISSGELNQAQERLSSGRRINSAADDAAGLAISERFTSQIRGLNQAVRNANDGISLIQTAEGALDESTNILQRIRELSIQSANGTFDNDNRATIDAEVQQLVAEVDRIAETTAFNGLNILDGSVGNLSLQVGAQSNQTIDLNIQSVDSRTLGLGSTSSDVLGDEIAANLQTLSFDAGDIEINGQSIGAFQGTGVAGGSQDTLQDLVNNISENVNGVTAGIVTEAAATSVGDGILEGNETFTIATTEADGTTTSFSIQNTQSLQELSNRINEQGGGRVSSTINDNGELVVSSQTARSIDITDAAGAGGDNIGDVAQAQISLTSDNGDPIEITRGNTGTLTDLANLGFRESGQQGVIEGAGLTSNNAATGLSVGDLTINGVQIDNEDTDSLNGRLNAINEVSDQTGVTANAFAQTTLDFADVNVTSAFAAANNLRVNGIDVSFAAGITTLQGVADEFNNQSTQTGVTATVSGTRLILESDQGGINLRNVSGVGAGATTISAGGDIEITRFDASGASTASFSAGSNATIAAGIQLTATNGNPISVELGGDTAAERTAVRARVGLLESNNTEGGRFGASLNSINVTTAANAQRAIGVVDNALETINSVRGDLGAVNNRLDFTINNLSNVSQNASASRSRIEDADFAAESAALSRAQVLQQAGTAILAQANAAPQQVL